MYGLEAISHANGWAMALVGASIVLTGLSVLSFLISQLHRLVDMFESDDKDHKVKSNREEETNRDIPERLSEEVGESSKVYVSVTGKLGDSFKLADLYCLYKEIGLPHPHLSIRNFRNSGILIPVGEGKFSWKLTSA